jgi:hypothetical protein
VAQSLGLPASSAVEIDSTLDIISAIILGPELKGKVLGADAGRVIGKITGCPMINAHRNIGNEPIGTSAHC